MYEFGKKYNAYVTMVPVATTYDITQATSDIEDMETALDAVTEIAFGCGRTIPILGTVELTADMGDVNPCGVKEKIYKLTFNAGGIEDDTAGTNTTLVKGLDGTLKNIYVYDKKTGWGTTQADKTPANTVFQCLSFLCKVRESVSANGKPMFAIECTSQYHGSVSSKVIMNKDYIP